MTFSLIANLAFALLVAAMLRALRVTAWPDAACVRAH
jgi:hypothetical protein